MTVGQLIDALDAYDPETPVGVIVSVGDGSEYDPIEYLELVTNEFGNGPARWVWLI